MSHRAENRSGNMGITHFDCPARQVLLRRRDGRQLTPTPRFYFNFNVPTEKVKLVALSVFSLNPPPLSVVEVIDVVKLGSSRTFSFETS